MTGSPPVVRLFIAGSRAIARVPDPVAERLDRVIAAGHEVVIGDANGADKAVQKYFAAREYRNVRVFCTGGHCRNNVGDWPVAAVAPPAGTRSGFDFYTVKDREMVSIATHGLMLWDGESRGTAANIRNLLAQAKPVVVFVAPTRTVHTLRTFSDLDSLGWTLTGAS
jgi:hypothetical protein